MDEVEGPAAVLVASREHHVDGFAHAAVGLDFRVAQIVQSAQNVIVPRRRIRKTQPTFINYFSGAQRAEQGLALSKYFSPRLRAWVKATDLRPARSYASNPSSTLIVV